MTADLRTALHRMVDAAIAYGEAAGDEIPQAEKILRQNISALLTLLDGRDEAG